MAFFSGFWLLTCCFPSVWDGSGSAESTVAVLVSTLGARGVA